MINKSAVKTAGRSQKKNRAMHENPGLQHFFGICRSEVLIVKKMSPGFYSFAIAEKNLHKASNLSVDLTGTGF